MNVTTLSLDTRGAWSPAQAAAVLRQVEREAAGRGLFLEAAPIPGSDGRVRLLGLCLDHRCAVDEDNVCVQCVALMELGRQ